MSPAARTNILIVMTDHQRADTILPDHPTLTPNLDRLTRDGLIFERCYCPSPHCCPSRATFHSGLYPSRHGVWNNVLNDQALSRGLNPGVRLFSDDLSVAGYAMHFFGKWHVSAEEDPSDRGWQQHYSVACKRDNNTNPWDAYRTLAGEPEPIERGEGEILRPGYGVYSTYGVYEPRDTHDDRTLAAALDVLPQLAGKTDPWCMFVGFNAPHDPYYVPSRFLDMYALDDIPLPASYADDMADKPAIYKRMRDQVWGQLSERELREAIRHYHAACTALDDRFGQLLQSLKDAGCADDTFVLYCSDHGDYRGDHGLFAKGIPCFDGAYHVPAAVRWPNGIVHPGRRVSEFISLADFAPTFLRIAGIDTPREFTGASLDPFLRDETPDDWRDALFTQCNGVELYYTQRSVMTADYKYVFNGFDNDELYDLRTDPHEMINRTDDPILIDVKRDMCRRLWRFAHEQNDSATHAYITVGLAPFGPAEAFR